MSDVEKQEQIVKDILNANYPDALHILCTARSGSGYATRVLESLANVFNPTNAYKFEHEFNSYGQVHGEATNQGWHPNLINVSWVAVPTAMRETKNTHWLVRNPYDTINSIIRRGFLWQSDNRYGHFARNTLASLRTRKPKELEYPESLFIDACFYYAEWSSMIRSRTPEGITPIKVESLTTLFSKHIDENYEKTIWRNQGDALRDAPQYTPAEIKGILPVIGYMAEDWGYE